MTISLAIFFSPGICVWDTYTRGAYARNNSAIIAWIGNICIRDGGTRSTYVRDTYVGNYSSIGDTCLKSVDIKDADIRSTFARSAWVRDALIDVGDTYTNDSCAKNVSYTGDTSVIGTCTKFTSIGDSCIGDAYLRDADAIKDTCFKNASIINSLEIHLQSFWILKLNWYSLVLEARVGAS